MNRGLGLKTVFGQFFKTTTLHGFKYLWSEFRIDRWGWMLGCIASTCCAGVLCLVLWERFLDVPALLELQDVPVGAGFTNYMPQLIVCSPLHTVAIALLKNTDMSMVNASMLSKAISNVITKQNTPESQLDILNQLLSSLDVSLTDALLKYSPACDDLIVRCRWQKERVSCQDLFEKEVSTEGVCCIMRPSSASKKLNVSLQQTNYNRQTKSVDLSLQCSNETIRSCTFSARYNDEKNVQPMKLSPGYVYTAQMSFISVPMDSTEELIASNCVADKNYSKESCQEKCAENYCGCKYHGKSIIIDGLDDEETNHQKCTIKQQTCLRKYEETDNLSCVCLPSCNKITSDIILESAKMDLDIFAIDPIYHGLNSKSTVLHFQLNLHSSKIFSLNPTENWITLLSSLGGVFNMFLGVGLFSALEILCLFLFKLPSILLKSQVN